MGIAILMLYIALILRASIKALRGPGPAAAEASSPRAGEAGRLRFFVNNRSGSAMDVALSIIVSCIGASATIGMIGLAFNIGTPAFWWLGAGCFGLSLLSFLLARKVRESGAYTMPQLVENYLGPKAKPLISLVIVVAWMGILAAQFVAVTGVLGVLTGLGKPFCLAIGFGLIVFHTLGGQAAIMKLDRVQALILMGALAVFLIWLSRLNPGWPAAADIELVNDSFPPEKLLYYLLVVGGNYLVCPMLFGRFLSAENGREARLGGIFAVIGLALGALLIISVGLACRSLIPADTHGDQVLSAALALAPAWLNLVMSIALISAIVSSADSCLLTASTVLSHDLLGSDKISVSRRCVVALGLTGLCVSLLGKDILAYLLMAYDVYVCGVVAPVFVAMLAGPNKVRPAPARLSVICGGCLGACAALSGLPCFSYAGLLAATLICLIGIRRAA